jgi:hypothetical protein
MQMGIFHDLTAMLAAPERHDEWKKGRLVFFCAYYRLKRIRMAG